MVGGGERQHVGDQHQPAVAVRAGLVVAPAHHQPHHQRDREERDGVHLLVHDRLVPHRPRRRAHQHAAERRAVAGPAVGYDRPEPSLRHQEPERRRARAGHRREQVDPHRVRLHQRHEAEDVRQQHEQRVARRVGNAQHLGRGDVLRRVPERRRRRQREHVDHEDESERGQRPEVGRAFLRGVGHGLGVNDGTGGGRSSPWPCRGDWPPRSLRRRARSRPAG